MRHWLVLFLLVPLPVPRCGETSIDLASAVERAKACSLELSSAYEDLRIDETRLILARRVFLPTLSLGYAQNDTVSYDGPDTRTKRISLAVEQVLFDDGERGRDLELKKKSLGLARRAARFLEEELVLSVVEQYTGLLARGLRSGIMEETLAAARLELLIAEEERRLGEITETEALLAAAAVKDLELELNEARWEQRRARFEFEKLLGCRDGESLQPEGCIDLGYAGFTRTDEEERYLELARKNSTEIEELLLELQDLRAKVKSEERRYLPEVGLGLELSVSGAEFPLSEPGFSLSLRLAWAAPGFPLSLGLTAGKQGVRERSRAVEGSVRAAGSMEDFVTADIARARLVKAAWNFEGVMRSLRFSIREELAAAEREARSISLLKEKLRIGERKLSVGGLMLELGEITRVEHMEEAIDVSKTRVALIDAVVNLFRRETSLLRLCGISGFGRRPPPILTAEIRR